MTPPLHTFLAAIGIDALGVVSACDPMETYGVYCQTVGRGVPAQLQYLKKNAPCRQDFSAILPECRSVLCCAVRLPEAVQTDGIEYARFCAIEDYHAVLRKKLDGLLGYLQTTYAVAHARTCVDSAPVLERELGVRAGLGFIGYNRMLIHPLLGSHIMLGELFVDADLSPFAHDINYHATPPLPNRRWDALVPGALHCKCGAARRRCIGACPTGALSCGGYDYSRCLSYWSTQHRGEIPDCFADAMRGMIWGCDRCQTACPLSSGKFAVSTVSNPIRLCFEDIFTLSGKALGRKLALTVLAGANPNMIIRNACIVAANTRRTDLIPLIRPLAQNHHCDWVRTTAAHCLQKLEFP